jgi:hypothetical protein
MKNPFAPSRIVKKRDTPRRIGPDRVKLTGEAKKELRRRAFERSGGKCEAMRQEPGAVMYFRGEGTLLYREIRCNKPITWESMELSHNRHAANKSDELGKVIASCRECHQVGKHNPKSCPRRPGSVMNLKAAEAYWNGEVCIGCSTAEESKPKKARESFCGECRAKLQLQTAHDLENSDSPRDYCEALARGELEIIAADVRAKVEAKTA